MKRGNWDTDTHRGLLCEHEGRYWGERNVRVCQEATRGKESHGADPPLLPSEGTNPANTLVLDLYLPELWDRTFLLVKAPSLWYSVTAAPASKGSGRDSTQLRTTTAGQGCSNRYILIRGAEQKGGAVWLKEFLKLHRGGRAWVRLWINFWVYSLVWWVCKWFCILSPPTTFRVLASLPPSFISDSSFI